MHCSGTLHCRRMGCRGRTEQDGLSFIEHWGGSGAPGCPLSLLSLWVIPQQFSHCWMQLKVDGRTCGSLARLDEVGADAPCVTDEPEAETLPSGEPSSSSHPSSSTPRVSGPSLPWIDVNDELEWPGGPLKYDPFDRPRSRSPRTN